MSIPFVRRHRARARLQTLRVKGDIEDEVFELCKGFIKLANDDESIRSFGLNLCGGRVGEDELTLLKQKYAYLKGKLLATEPTEIAKELKCPQQTVSHWINHPKVENKSVGELVEAVQKGVLTNASRAVHDSLSTQDIDKQVKYSTIINNNASAFTKVTPKGTDFTAVRISVEDTTQVLEDGTQASQRVAIDVLQAKEKLDLLDRQKPWESSPKA